MKILGIDYGDARIGISISSGFLAVPLQVYNSQTMRKDIDYIASLAKSHSIELIVLGLALNMDGSEGARASKTRSFGKVLERVSGVRVVYEDERLTTVEAEEILDINAVKKNKRKKVIDMVAAVIILQGYLDRQKIL